jgi:hypothetical protein
MNVLILHYYTSKIITHNTFCCQSKQCEISHLQYKQNIGGASPARLSFHLIAVSVWANVDRKIDTRYQILDSRRLRPAKAAFFKKKSLLSIKHSGADDQKKGEIQGKRARKK